jgi:hypothetical protein
MSVTAGPRLQWLHRLAADRSWSVTLLQTGSTVLDPDSLASWELAEVFAMLADRPAMEILDELVDTWRSTDVNRMFPSLIRAASSARPGVVVVPTAQRGAGWWL